MFFAKMTDSGVEKMPISENNLRKILETMSIPSVITPEALDGTGYICVRYDNKSEPLKQTKDQKISLVDIVPDTDGYWKPVYKLVEVTGEYKETRLAKKLDEIRSKRHGYFAELDAEIARSLRHERLGLNGHYPLSMLDAYGVYLSDITSSDPFLVVIKTLQEFANEYNK